MLDKSTAIPAIIEQLQKLPPGHAIDLRTYKRNRSVLIVKDAADRYAFQEDGFFQETFEVPEDRLKKTLKTLFKKEFPRSNKIRLYKLGQYSQRNPEELHKKVL
jgi:hypothetical protein